MGGLLLCLQLIVIQLVVEILTALLDFMLINSNVLSMH